MNNHICILTKAQPLHYNPIISKVVMTAMKRISTDRKHSRERTWRKDTRLRGPYVKDWEPALELCMRWRKTRKIQRRTGVNGERWTHRVRQLGWYRRAFGPFWGLEAFFVWWIAKLDRDIYPVQTRSRSVKNVADAKFETKMLFV